MRGKAERSCIEINTRRLHLTYNPGATWPCGRSPANARSTAAIPALTASKGLCGATALLRREKLSNPDSSSRIIKRRERPKSCVCSSCSSSKRSMSSRRLAQSSWSMYLQYISTTGSSCMQAARIAWLEGAGKPSKRRHTSWPAHKQRLRSHREKSQTTRAYNSRRDRIPGDN